MPKKKIIVYVKPLAKKQNIQQEGEIWKISLLSPPEKDRANRELIQLLATHFHIPQKSIHILQGRKSRKKTILLDIPEKSSS